MKETDERLDPRALLNGIEPQGEKEIFLRDAKVGDVVRLSNGDTYRITGDVSDGRIPAVVIKSGKVAFLLATSTVAKKQ